MNRLRDFSYREYMVPRSIAGLINAFREDLDRPGSKSTTRRLGNRCPKRDLWSFLSDQQFESSSQNERCTQTCRNILLAIGSATNRSPPEVQEFTKGRSAAAREIEPSSETRLGHHLPTVVVLTKRFGIGFHGLRSANARCFAEVLLPVPNEISPHRSIDPDRGKSLS